MADTERGNDGALGSGSGAESSTGGAVATEEGLQDDSLRGAGRELSQTVGVKPKRVVFPIAGKGGVGKTTVLATLAEWYAKPRLSGRSDRHGPRQQGRRVFESALHRSIQASRIRKLDV